MKDVKDDLEQAQELVEKASEELEPLKVENVLEDMKPYLNNKVYLALSNKVDKLMGFHINGRVKYVTRYFGLQVSLPEVGIKKLAEILNDIGNKYNILGSLGVNKINLMNPTLYFGKIGFFAFVALSPNDAVQVENHKWSFREGEAPRVYLETPEDVEKLS